MAESPDMFMPAMLRNTPVQCGKATVMLPGTTALVTGDLVFYRELPSYLAEGCVVFKHIEGVGVLILLPVADDGDEVSTKKLKH